MRRTVVPAPVRPGTSWLTDTTWRVGAPNLVVGSSDRIAVTRGPKIELGRLASRDVVAEASWLLPDRVTGLDLRSDGVTAVGRDGRVWDCQPGKPAWPSTRDSDVSVDIARRPTNHSFRGTAWSINRRGRLCSDSQPCEIALGSPTLQAAAIPQDTPLGHDGWDLFATAMNGLWAVDSTPGAVRTHRLHGRPARWLTGDDHLWAVFDDEIRLLGSWDLDNVVIHFEAPFAAVSLDSLAGVLVATRARTWQYSNDGVGAPMGFRATDMIRVQGGVVSVFRGTLTYVPHDGHELHCVAGLGGEPSSLKLNPANGTLTLAAAPKVVEFDVSTLEVTRQWRVDFGPLAAVSASGRVFICGGESGLYVADGAGVESLTSLGLEAAIDVCAAGSDALVVSTGAGVARIDVAGRPRVTARVKVPGVAGVASSTGRVVAHVEGALELLSTDALTRAGRIDARVDPRRVVVDGEAITVCGYDGVEVVGLE